MLAFPEGGTAPDGAPPGSPEFERIFRLGRAAHKTVQLGVDPLLALSYVIWPTAAILEAEAIAAVIPPESDSERHSRAAPSAAMIPSMGTDTDTAALAPDARSLAELLAERLDAGRGNWTLELEYEDGRLRRVHRHERFGAMTLSRFDEAPAPQS